MAKAKGGESIEAGGPSASKIPLPAQPSRGWKGRLKGRAWALMELILRFIALAATVAAVIIMGTVDQTLPVFTQFFQFEAKFTDLPAFTYFVIANAVTGGYLVLTMLVGIAQVVRPKMAMTRIMMMPTDTIIVAVQTSGAAAATAIEYVMNKGNSKANWFSVCQQFDTLCRQSIVAIAVSFSSVIALLLLILLSAFALFPVLRRKS